MNVTKTDFGVTKQGKRVTLFCLENGNGMGVEVLDYGCTIRAIRVPDRAGRTVDVCLGYGTVTEYEEHPGYLGAVVGRHANRIGRGLVEVGGTEYPLAINDGPNHLHGGLRGFDKRVWAWEPLPDGLRFTRTSPDGEEGYPGSLKVEVTYTLSEDNRLTLRYRAVSDADTVLNMTNHTYFNLGGEGSGSILDHTLRLNAGGFAENDPHCLPTGRTLPVEATPFDFRRVKPIGRDIGADCVQLRYGKGYDHNYVLEGPGPFREAAELCCPATGVRMRVTTTKPCIQLYTGNVLDGPVGKSGVPYEPHAGLCLETQFYPDSIARGIQPGALLKRGEVYDHTTTYQFDLV